ncbi:MAG: glycosyltransferase family 4 protein [Gemmatimonadales bacterium]|nr:glycosyltransferase family 4 protein [Gemmatimonadales bacterium]MBA3555324.1 glycosyltransferase family 4 protein [Gemmatimonadales bacterium]
MRILLLAPHPFYQARGTPIAVKMVLEFLGARGHQVDVLTYHEGMDVSIPNCRIHRIPRVPGVSNIRPGFSFKKLVCDGVMFASCLRMMRRNRYDLVHAVEEAAFIAVVMKSLTGVPYVYDMDSSLAEQMIDSFPRLEMAYPALRRFEAAAVRRSAGVLTVCAALEDVAHGHAPGTPVGRVEDTTLLSDTRNPNGTALLPNETAGAPVAMYVGNLEHYQGIDLLLEGFRHTLDRVPEARLVIVGGRDDDIARYTRRCAALGIRPAVLFLGPKPVTVLADLLREADVLVSPRLKGLNTPMKIYSYLDSGTAVLATRLRTHTQVLDDRTAYLVDPEPLALGSGLAALLRDPSLRQRLASHAKDYVQREFTPEAARRKLESFYAMIESRAAGARA